MPPIKESLNVNRYYVWYYNDELEIMVVPIGFYTYQHAKLSLIAQFGREIFDTMYITSGRLVKKRKMRLAGLVIPFKGKYYQVKKYIFPAEYSINRSLRRHFAKALKKELDNMDSEQAIDNYLNKLYIKNYGTFI
jgi:hypothetical protein